MVSFLSAPVQTEESQPEDPAASEKSGEKLEPLSLVKKYM